MFHLRALSISQGVPTYKGFTNNVLKFWNRSNSTKANYDIVILGGGLVGATLACTLGKNDRLSDKSILLLEGSKKSEKKLPECYSNRVSSLNQATFNLLNNIGAWSHISRYGSVRKMQVWESHSEAVINFAGDAFAENLAFIVENDLILFSVYKELENLKNVQVLHEASPQNLILSNDNRFHQLTMKNGAKFDATLLLGCDGHSSRVRQEMGVLYVSRSYDQMGVVATLELEEGEGENTTAWQTFLPTGPIALLPLNSRLSSLVWSTTPSHAKKLLSLSDLEFTEELNNHLWSKPNRNIFVEKSTRALDQLFQSLKCPSTVDKECPPKIIKCQEQSRASFPLGFGHASNYVQKGVALVGDAAHRIHPLAGQGVNLGFGDITCLNAILGEAVYAGRELGTPINDVPPIRANSNESFCMTPILSKGSKNLKNYEDLELLSLSDRETKPPSRRSVRIETPFSVKSGKSNSSSESIKRPKSILGLSPMTSSRADFKEPPGLEKVNDVDENKRVKDQNFTDCGITIPKPFQMTVRDEENQIVEKCMIEMNNDKNKEKPEMFKALPVPIESQIPLFDKLMADQEYKNHLVRERRKADLQSQMRPFSFTKRDEESQFLSKRLSKSSPCIFLDEKEEMRQFKAKPVPKNLFSNYIYHKMYEDEFYRSLKKKIRAAEMLKAASLPPSMAKREQNRKIYDVCPKSYKSMTYGDEFPEFMRSKKIPDFKKFHDYYDKELEELKNEFISTSPRPFKFSGSKSKSVKYNKNPSSSTSSRSNSASGLSAISRSNLAAVLRIESARKRLQNHMDQKLEQSRLKEEARWREKIMRKKPIWQSLAYSNEEDLQMRLRLRKDEERLRNEEHRLRMQLMFGRVNQQPTLFERQSQMKYPSTKEEILEEFYRENKATKPRRSVSDLSGGYYNNEMKEDIPIDHEELDEIVLEKRKSSDENLDQSA